jgi:DNA-binding GntR family transcriptional regulator
MNELDGITRNYLHDQVANRLRALIQSGQLKPDDRLNESELAERFGISRTPLREAIKILATEGLLELLPNRGARVARFSEAEVDEMLVVIAALEATAGELACRHIDAAGLAAIEALHTRMVAAYADRDVPAYFELNRLIHEAIMKASRNGTLEGIYATLSGRIQRARFAAHKTPQQWQDAMADHDRMIALLRARDGGALGSLLRDHVLSKKPVIIGTFGDQAAGPDA